MAIELSDDGTMDTVLRCTDCGEEFRFSYDGPDEQPDTSEWTDGERDWFERTGEYPEDRAADAYDAFVDWAIEDATNDHECPSADDSEPQEPDTENGDIVERGRYA